MSQLPKTSGDNVLDQVLADYLKAADAGQAPEKAALLSRHPELRVELEAFFTAQEKVAHWTQPLRELFATPSTVNDQLTMADKPHVAGHEENLAQFGDYELLTEIARGGMGVVYRARQKRLNRVVALKMMLAGNLATATDVQRLRGEAEAAARLDHPHIVPIYEVNQHEGQHFFTMKLIEGDNLAQIQKSGASFGKDAAGQRRTATLLVLVARAVHYAHQHGILHRDLKPANILLDDKGVPHVSDFGLAKRVGGDEDNATVPPALTQSGAIIGTPAYMAPEQADGKIALSTAADTYSLGAILFELLTGQPPFRGDSPLDTVLQVREREVPRPRSLNPLIAYDLETICLKCLEKDPNKRYPSALALADDLERWLADEPILGRRLSRWERTRKWARRHPAVSALLGVTGASAASLLVLAGFSWHNAELRAEAVQNLGEARAALGEAKKERKAALANVQQLQKEADDEKTNLEKLKVEAEVERAKAKNARSEAGHILYAADMQFSQAALEADDTTRLFRLLENHRPAAGQEDLRGFEWNYLWRQLHRDRYTLTDHAPKSRPSGAMPDSRESVLVAIAPDNKTFASVGADKKLRLWDLKSGRLLHTLTGPGQAVSLAYTDQGKKLQMAVCEVKAKLATPGHLQDVISSKVKPSLNNLYANLSLQTLDLENPGPLLIEKFTPAGLTTSAAFFKLGMDVAAIMTDSMVPLKSKALFAPAALALMPDGKTLVLAGFNTVTEFKENKLDIRQAGAVLLWDLVKEEEKTVLPAQKSMVVALAVAPDGTLATAGMDRTIKLWKPNGELRATLTGARAPLTALLFSADNKRLFSGAVDGIVTAWDVDSGKVEQVLLGHQEAVFGLAVAGDGATLVSASADGLVKVWDLAMARGPASLHFDGAVNSLVFAADGKTLFAVSQNGQFKSCDTVTGKDLSQRQMPFPAMAAPASIAADGKLVAFSNALRNVLSVQDTSNGTELQAFPYLGFGELSIFSPADNILALSTRATQKDADITLWNIDSGKELIRFKAGTQRIRALAFSRDGKWLAAGSQDKSVYMWNPAGGRSFQFERAEPVQAVAFSSDGTLLAVATVTKVGIHQAADGKEVLSFPTYTHNVVKMVFSPDGKRLATAGSSEVETGRGGGLKLWDVASGRETFSLGDSEATVSSLAFSPDGSRLAAAFTESSIFATMSSSNKSVVRIWETGNGD
jgi:eukaryotic-like serine/threonine-protein kinase